MIGAARVEEVRRLLAAGISRRAIARQTGVSRGTVAGIAAGRPLKRLTQPPGELPLDAPGPRRRCRACGAMVYLPCRACGLRETLARFGRSMRRRAPALSGDEPLGLDLRPEHLARYRRVRQQKLRRVGDM